MSKKISQKIKVHDNKIKFYKDCAFFLVNYLFINITINDKVLSKKYFSI